MKKVVLFAAVVFGITTINAQKIYVGGDYSLHTEKDAPNTYSWAPKVGYVVNDNWMVGATAQFGKSSMEVAGSETDVMMKSRKIGGFVRYTKSLNDLFSVYGELGGGWQKLSPRNGDMPNKQEGYYINLKPAFSMSVGNGFGLSFNLGGVEYSHMNEHHTDVKSQKVAVTLGKEINIGLAKTFNF